MQSEGKETKNEYATRLTAPGQGQVHSVQHPFIVRAMARTTRPTRESPQSLALRPDPPEPVPLAPGQGWVHSVQHPSLYGRWREQPGPHVNPPKASPSGQTHPNLPPTHPRFPASFSQTIRILTCTIEILVLIANIRANTTRQEPITNLCSQKTPL
jgi:hypothetical protein